VLTEWIHWLSSLHQDQLLLFLLGLLLTDVPRYALTKLALSLWHWAKDLWRALSGESRPAFDYCPSVGVIVAGYNEEETIEATLESLWGSYPRMELIVVDDGSTDGMTPAAKRFAATHEGVVVLRREERGGKSSAMNWGVRYTQAEVIIVVDADSHLGPSAVWELVQPLKDPQVGAVSGAVVARNPFESLATWLQAYEYLSTIFIGRMASAWLSILGIVSGAFGAFRRSALERVHGWDAGPPEDLDLTLALRKSGYKIAFAPYSQCLTEVPSTFKALIKQRLRWERSGVVRNHCRKHIDLADVRSASFRFSNLCVLLESWFFNIFCMFGIWIWAFWFVLWPPDDWWQILLALYLCYLVFEVLQIAATIYFTNAPWQDTAICLVFFLAPLYQIMQLAVRLVATVEEIFFRKSFQDNYVPLKVRQATWHW
jgi:poly-beta-1,6-N-acetyl-D-glucosamine synthase